MFICGRSILVVFFSDVLMIDPDYCLDYPIIGQCLEVMVKLFLVLFSIHGEAL